MKSVILAAGKGMRMLPLTKTIPKVLVEVNGKPFLHYVIENLKKAGFTEFGIVVGYMKENVADFLKENGIEATLIEQEQQLGTGDAVKQAKEFCGDENFIVLGGDNLFAVQDLQSLNKSDDLCYVIGKEIEDPRKYGVLIVENDKLIKIIEKPQIFVGNMINAGLYKFTSDIWPALDQMELSERGEYELTDALTNLAEQGKVKVESMKGHWLDLGCKEDIPKIENSLNLNINLY
jgi:dTDP-glucose pyrophosphorylase